MKQTIFITFLVFFISSFTVSKRVDAMINKEIKSVFETETYTKELVSIPSEINNTLALQITDTNFFKINSNNKNLGYYYLGQAYGKADYFDFIVLFDKDLLVS